MAKPKKKSDLTGSGNSSGTIPETELLEFARDFEQEFDLAPEDVRPCIAGFYYQGVITQKEPYGFLLGLELSVLGLPDKQIRDALCSYSSRLSRPLPRSDIEKLMRRFQSNRYPRPYSCKRFELSSLCIGDICPWRSFRQGKGAKRGPIMSSFFSLGWPGALRDPYAALLYLSLHQLRQLQQLGASEEFRFNYQRISKLSGLTPPRITERLKMLESVGLIAELEIGASWESGERRRTRVKLTWPIPEPVL